MAGMFDDLIPAARGPGSTPAAGMFDDLIPVRPDAAAAPAAADVSFDPNDTSPAAYGGLGPDGRLKDAPTTDQAWQGLHNAVGALGAGVPFADRGAAAITALTGIKGHRGD